MARDIFDTIGYYQAVIASYRDQHELMQAKFNTTYKAYIAALAEYQRLKRMVDEQKDEIAYVQAKLDLARKSLISKEEQNASNSGDSPCEEDSRIRGRL